MACCWSLAKGSESVLPEPEPESPLLALRTPRGQPPKATAALVAGAGVATHETRGILSTQ